MNGFGGHVKVGDDKKRSVGLVVMTYIDGFGSAALLQRRGEFNHEHMREETWPGGCQVTVHGAVEEGESFEEALRRETEEELGSMFLTHALDNIDGDDVDLVRLVHVDEPKREVITFGVHILPALIRIIALGPSSGGLRLLRRSEVDGIQDLRSFNKKDGVADRRVVAMFPDEIEAVQNAFARLA